MFILKIQLKTMLKQNVNHTRFPTFHKEILKYIFAISFRSKTPKSKKAAARTLAAPPTVHKTEEGRYMDSCMQNTAYFYNTLLYAFQYLKVQDLLRAGCVCRMWRDIASHPSLWRTVRMKNSQVHSFEGNHSL